MGTSLEQAWGKTLKAGGYHRESVQAWLDAHGLVVWAAFPNFGRVHHVASKLKQWEKALERSKAHALTAFQGPLAAQGITYRDVTDIFVDDLKDHRLSVMYFQVKAQGTWGPEQMDEITMAAASKYIDGFSQLPPLG